MKLVSNFTRNTHALVYHLMVLLLVIGMRSEDQRSSVHTIVKNVQLNEIKIEHFLQIEVIPLRNIIQIIPNGAANVCIICKLSKIDFFTFSLADGGSNDLYVKKIGFNTNMQDLNKHLSENGFVKENVKRMLDVLMYIYI